MHLILAITLLAAGLAAQQPPAPNRFPPLKLDDTSGDQRTLAERMMKETRVGLGGPWNILLRSPNVGQAMVDLYHYFRWNSSLSNRLVEFAIVVTAREASAPYEWFIHYPLSLKEGTSAATLAQVREGRQPSSATEGESAAYTFATELLRHRMVSDDTFQKAKTALGEKGVVDLTALVGTYQAIGGMLNVAQVWGTTGNAPQYLPMPAKRR
jgi:4-carboxymuconolactone decarboxylase